MIPPHFKSSAASAGIFFLAFMPQTALSQAPTGTAKFGEQTFTFPGDYTLDRVAGPPLVDRPIQASLDDRGRLYVTESSGSNDPAEVQRERKPHRVLRLTDRDGDGIYDERTVFADGLMFPEGCLWKDGSLYVAAVPEIWKFTDADDDGVAEKREVWFDGKTMTGCVNDLHGPYDGPDGWLYWCKGAFAEQKYDLPGQPGWTTRASHVFRARADGSGIEPVFTAGMDNPVGLAWTPEGELIVAGTFFQNPAGGQRDGLIHAIYGGVWGKDHDVLTGHPRTGTLMPPMTHLGPAAPCGMTRYGRDLLVCQFNLRQVSRHVLQPQGATYMTHDEPFLVCDQADFHPTDVLQASDGSVLVVDTGGWYKLCCPTSQIAKPQVLGAIYRLRKIGGEVPVAVPVPLWTNGDVEDAALQMENLRSAQAHVRRRAAEALGRARTRVAVPALLQALAAQEMDRFLFHALSYALLQIRDAPATKAGLASQNPTVVAACLYALQQMPEGNLTSAEVLPSLGSMDDKLREAAMFVINQHGDWQEEIKAWVSAPRTAEHSEALGRVVEHFAGEDWAQEWLGRELSESKDNDHRHVLLKLMQGASRKELPAAWAEPLMKLLQQADQSLQLSALEVLKTARTQGHAKCEKLLRQLAADTDRSMPVRIGALAARTTKEISEGEFSLILDQIKTRSQSLPAILVGKTPTIPQLRSLAPLLSEVGILERPALVKCFIGCDDSEVGAALVKALKMSDTYVSMPRALLLEVIAGMPKPLRLEITTAISPPAAAEQIVRLDELENSLPAGDVSRGAALFQSPRAACMSCHPVGYKGGNLGPDLSKVGAVRTRRDLLESIAFPSASFVRSYEPMQVMLADGTTNYGILTNQDAESITLNLSAVLPVVRIPRTQIQSITPGTFSLMPQGLDRILGDQDLADIVAYLQSLK